VARRIISLILIFTLWCFLPALADETQIINGTFESSTPAFTNTYISEKTPFQGDFCGNIKHSAPTFAGGKYLHDAEYIYPVYLQKGKVYRFSMTVMEEGAGNDVPSVSTDYIKERNRIFFDVENISGSWQTVTCAFIAGATGDFDIGIRAFSQGAEGISVDNITIIKTEEKPVSMEIIGRRSVFVPTYSHEIYRYSAAAVDRNGEIIPIIKGGIEFGELPEGVSMLSDGEGVTVSNNAVSGTSFKVKTVETSESMLLPQKEIDVVLDNNYIENGNFEDYPRNSGFEVVSGIMDIVDTSRGAVARIETEGDTHSASLSIEKTYVLSPGKMYVFRASVYSEQEYVSRYTEASRGLVDENGVININISNPGNEPTRILSVIRVLAEGIYQIKLNFTNYDSRPVYIHEMGLFEEERKASEILIKAPAYIAQTDETITVPIPYTARDQEGTLMEDVTGVSLRLSENAKGLLFEGNVLTVTPEAKSGVYKIIAENEDKTITKTVTVEIGKESVGDGGFEKYAPGEWFSTAEPSILTFADGEQYGFDSGKIARLQMGGSVSAVLSDSVYSFKAGEVYVFGGKFETAADISPTVLTLLLCDVNDVNFSDTVAVMQISVNDREVKEVFIPSRSFAARLMLGFTVEAADQTVYFDNLYIEKAKVSCSNVGIGGYPYSGMVISGRHKFESNFNAREISTYRWLISSTEDGVYMPIEGQTDASLSVSGDMVGSFVKFEVTPISLNGPVFGESVMSAPVGISKPPSHGNVEAIVPEEPEEKDEETEPEKSEAKTLSVVNIYSESFRGPVSFVDTEGHWAKEDIDIMSACGIANGKKNMLFMPDEIITRAEFSAFLTRAFSLAPLYYTGTFSDVKRYDWYSGVVETISKYGIAGGVGDNLFAPNDPITREQMTVMTMRAMALSGIKTESTEKWFSDGESISAWAKPSVNMAVNAGIVTGFDDGSFSPKSDATRAQAIAMIKRMITYVLNNK